MKLALDEVFDGNIPPSKGLNAINRYKPGD